MIQIAHRGASGEFPENSKTAFTKALESGIQMIELDVQLTLDDQIVIFHDFNTYRQTGHDCDIRDMLFAELKTLDLAAYDEKFKERESILTLQELFDIVPLSVMINIEIKNRSSEKNGIAGKVTEEIRRSGRADSVLISAFDHTVLREIYSLDSSVRLGVLLYSRLVDPSDYIRSLGFPVYSVHPAVELVDEETVDDLQKSGYRVYVYTVNSRKDFQLMKSYGVDGVITDFPGRFDSVDARCQ